MRLFHGKGAISNEIGDYTINQTSRLIAAASSIRYIAFIGQVEARFVDRLYMLYVFLSSYNTSHVVHNYLLGQ